VLATFAFHKTRLAQLLHYLLKKLHRQIFRFSQLGHAYQRPVHFGGNAKVDHGTKGVFASFGKLHIG